MNANLKRMLSLLALLAGGLAPGAAGAGRDDGRLPRLVDLGADKCVPCKAMAPILQALKQDYAGRMDVEFIDVWRNAGAGKQYGIKLIPTQIFFAANGKELFRHEGFYGREDILAKWKELGVELGGGAVGVGLVRETPVTADARPREAVCFLCDGDVNPRTKAMVKGQTEQRVLCSPHCYFIYFSSIANADAATEDAKVSVTDWSAGSPVPAAKASYVYGLDAGGRATIAAFADKDAAARHLQASSGTLVTWDRLRAKELATRCGFCDRAVYPEDACVVKVGNTHSYGCCTHCSLGVAARLQRDIEVEARDALTGQAIRVRTLNGRIGSLEPAGAVAWFGQKRGPEGQWVSAGCFKQAFFANQANLKQWLEAHPAATGREISIAQALADKMQLTSEQMAKACKLGACQ